MCHWVPTVWIQLIGKLAKGKWCPKTAGQGWFQLLETPVTGCNPSNFLYDLSFGIRVNKSWRKTVVTQMATPRGFHDLFSHQVLGGEITSSPLLLHELRIVRDMRYLQKEGLCLLEISTQNWIVTWFLISLPYWLLYFEHAPAFPYSSLNTIALSTSLLASSQWRAEYRGNLLSYTSL
jgi:hypothetical protein